jgi:hypothetical protein
VNRDPRTSVGLDATPTPTATATATAGLLGRRDLFKAAALGAVLGGSGSLVAPASATTPASAVTDQEEASPYFDLRHPSSPVLLGARLHEAHRIMQSFGFDNVNQRLFLAQLQNATSGDDLCISELDLQGNLLGSMHLEGAGHGVSIGVEAVGPRSFLWTETRSSAKDSGGRGTALQRFEFVSGSAPADAQTFLAGSAVITCAVDQLHSQLLVRRLVDGRMELSVHDLTAAGQGDFSYPLSRVSVPGQVAGVFQGYALHGDHVYVLTGKGHVDPQEIDSRISCIDVHTGRLVQDVRTFAGRSLLWREPEGMAVHLAPDGRARLCFGLASHHPADPGVRLANIYAKDVLVGCPLPVPGAPTANARTGCPGATSTVTEVPGATSRVCGTSARTLAPDGRPSV